MKQDPANDRARLQHMLDAAHKSQTFMAGKSRDDLDRDEVLSLAVTRLLEIIGEAATQVTVVFKTAHPEIPWGKMIGMRNFVIHAYFEVDMDVVWDTVTGDVKDLIRQLEALMKVVDNE